MTVSIVVRCYNEAVHIERLLKGIVQQTQKDIEVIAVDSGSTDETVHILKRYPVKILHVAPEDFAFGYSCNLGCSSAQGEFVVFISAHAYPVYRTWLDDLLEPFQDPAVALAYGKQRGGATTKYSEHQIFATWYPEHSHLSQDHPFCNNANTAIRKSVWEKMPYDETLTGLEDLEWARRIMRAGYKIAYVAEAEIVHIHDEDPGRIFNRFYREAIAYKAIFPFERFTVWDFFRLYLGNVASDCYHAFRDGCMMANLIDITVFRFMQFLGAYWGINHKGQVSRTLRKRFYYPNGWRRSQPSSSTPKPKCVFPVSDMVHGQQKP